jgi:hypothetical protein
MLSDGDPIRERQLRKEDYYSFLHRIFTMHKKARAEEEAAENRFGRQK